MLQHGSDRGLQGRLLRRGDKHRPCDHRNQHPVRSGLHLHLLQHEDPCENPRANRQDPAAADGLRIRRVVRGDVRPAGRRNLHKGGGRGRGLDREAGVRDPRGRPPQPGGNRGPSRRQR